MKTKFVASAVFALSIVLVESTSVAQSVEEFRKLDEKFGSTQLSDIKKLAESGDVDAQGVLGLYYSNGIRVPRDKKLAEHWYLRAAKQGHQDAQYNLGQMYRNGDLGRPNYEAALYWYEQAAASNVVYAPSNIAGMYYQGMGVKRSPVLATMWIFVARQFGDEQAPSRLASLRRELSAGDFSEAENLASEWIRRHRSPQ